MARPKKKTVDYFPHSCTHGKTLFIIEQKYGNDGYAFWFKLLELLGDTDGHYIDLNDEMVQEFLQAKTSLSKEMCNEILDLLAKLKAIDAELWEHKIVWSQNFVDGISDVYKNRRVETPSRPSFYIQKPATADISTDENPQSKVKESKVKESKVNTPAQKPKPEKIKYADFVSLTNAEYEALVAKLGEDGAKRCIEILDNYKGATGKKYKSDYRAVLNWVVERYEEEQHKKRDEVKIRGAPPVQTTNFKQRKYSDEFYKKIVNASLTRGG
jgi:hypothetical protein